MGWLWSSSPLNEQSSSSSSPPATLETPNSDPSPLSVSTPSSSSRLQSQSQSQSQSQEICSIPPPEPTPSIPPETPPAPPSSSSRTPTREEIANAELLAYLQSLQRPSPSATNPVDDDLDDLDDDDDLDSPDSDPSSHRHLLTPAHLYPSTTSCRSLFDLASHCQSPGSQLLNIYRYGATRSCARHWSNFWWCMRTNNDAALNKEEREERVKSPIMM